MTDDFLRDNVEKLLAGEKELPSAEFLGRLQRELRAQPGVKLADRSRPFPWWQWPLAAVVLLGLAGLLFYPEAPQQKLTTGSVTLDDGRTIVAPSTFKMSSPRRITALEDSVLEGWDGARIRACRNAQMEIQFGGPGMNKAFMIAVLAGSVSCSNEKGTVDVAAGQVAKVDPAEPPRLVPKAQENEESREISALEIVAWMESQTKKKFIYSQDFGLKNMRMKGRMSDPARAYEIGLGLLKTLMVAAVPQDDEGTVLLTAAAIASKHTTKVYRSAAELPKADEFCCLSLQLKHASPRDIQAMLINKIIYPQNCLSMESTMTVVLSDYSSSLRGLADMAQHLDVPSTNYRIALSVLEGSNAADPVVPEEFKSLNLAKVVGRNRFVVLGDYTTRIEGKSARSLKPSSTILRVKGDSPLVVEFTGSAATGAGVLLDAFTVRPDGPEPLAGPLLQSREALQEGTWRFLGSFPGKKDGTVLILVARATREQE